MQLVSLALAVAACTTTTSSYPVRDGSFRAAKQELSATATSQPGALATNEGRVEAVTVNTIRIVPSQPGEPTLELKLGDLTHVTSHDRQISRAALAPGDEVRVSYRQLAGPVPKAVSIDLVQPHPN